MSEFLYAVLDIDDVKADTTPDLLAFSNETWNTHLTLDDYDEDFPRMWGVCPEEAKERWMRYCAERLPVLPAVPGSERAVRELPPIIRIEDLSSRRECQRDVTEFWVASRYERVERVHMARIDWDGDPDAHKRTKGDDLRDLNPDAFVDNELKHCMAAWELGITTVVLFGRQARHPRIELPPGILLGPDWEATGEHLNRAAERLLAA